MQSQSSVPVPYNSRCRSVNLHQLATIIFDIKNNFNKLIYVINNKFKKKI